MIEGSAPGIPRVTPVVLVLGSDEGIIIGSIDGGLMESHLGLMK